MSAERATISTQGAYGFRITDLAPGSPYLGPAEDSWPALHVERVGPPAEDPPARPPGTVVIGPERADIWIVDGRIYVERAGMTVRFATGERLDDRIIAHPYMALPAAIASRWLGRQALHGGAYAGRNGAWVLLGDKEAGKSSLLGWLLHRGRGVLTDDLAVIDGTTIYSGPRCVDLRAEAAPVLGGENVGILGNRERWRLTPAAVPPSMPVAGFVHLEWSDRFALEPLNAGDRLRRLVENSAFGASQEEAAAYLQLASLPFWRFARPRSWSTFERSNAELLDALEGSIVEPSGVQ